MTDAERERIEQELEDELGFRWTPQMRHGHKALRLWNALVSARVKIKWLQAIVGKLPNRCRTCRWYTEGCGSKDKDGVCKHSGLPPSTELGVRRYTWRHVERLDSCAEYVAAEKDHP